MSQNFPNGGVWSTNDPEITINTPTANSTNVSTSTPGSYWVYYTENHCSNEDSIQLTFATAPVININDTIICDNLFTVSGVSTFNGGTWSANDPSIIFSDVNVDNPNITILTPGIYTITHTDGQCGDVNQFTVTLIDDPQITGNPTSCSDNLNLSLAAPFVNGGVWSTNSTDISFDNTTADNVTVTATNTGSFWVYYTENQCNHIDSVELTFYGPPVFPLSDSLICDEDYTVSGVVASSGGTWSVTPAAGVNIVNPNSNNPDIEFTQTGVYTFTFTDNQCGFQDQVVYEFIAPPSADLIDQIIICPSQAPVTISIQNQQNVDSVLWLNGSTADSLVLQSEGYYTVDLLNECSTTTIGTLLEFDFCGIEVPNVITPNDDNANDQLTLKVGEVDNFEMIILNRWGNVVYESKDATQAWDGTNKDTGKLCANGTYFYKIVYKELNSSEDQFVEGFVTLVGPE